MNRSAIFIVISFVVYLLAQVMLFRQLVLFNTAFCFLYVAFVLMLPIETNNLALMLIAFVLGFLVDVFYDSLGLHAMSLVLIAYLRNYWLVTITPQGGYDAGEGPTLAANGLQWFLVYTLPLLFIHHFVLFFTEAGGFRVFWFTMSKVMSSLLFTLFVVLFLQYFSFDRRR
ncbi:MAG: rod shape-determining protein MreD [Bacteroidetes bacterium]|nr:rod shape-determining protein MreD [Bacteroidota bacterium]MBS1975742.1 rod shape-determining protein MreD [Bacteroidota bacterium]